MLASDQLSFRTRVLRAGLWSVVGYVLTFAIRLGGNLFMTRQLVPEMFGIMAIANTVLIGLAMLSDLGLKPSVIQNKRGEESVFLNTAWVTDIVRGVVLCLSGIAISFIVGFAPPSIVPTASVYSDRNLPYVIAVLSLTTLIAGFESTKSLQANRSLMLAKIIRIDVVAQILGLAVMVSWVLLYPSIWALVAGAISSTAARTALSHISLPGSSNSWQWDRQAFAEIMVFGKWIFLSSVLYFLASNGDRLILAGLIDSTSLGIYGIAFLIFSSVDQILSKIVYEVTFPALSELARDHSAKLKQVYYKFHSAIASFTYFCCGTLIVSGQTIIGLLYDNRYQQAGWMLQILAVALISLPVRVTAQCFLALGLARVYFHLNAIRLLTLMTALPVGYLHWGLRGALWGIVFSYFSGLPVAFFHAAKIGLLDIRRELLALSALFLGLFFGEALNTGVHLLRIS
jgi:O-antigen/teichoic acid export membrane protein